MVFLQMFFLLEMTASLHIKKLFRKRQTLTTYLHQQDYFSSAGYIAVMVYSSIYND